MAKSSRELIFGNTVKCLSCNQIKLLTHFHKHKGRKFGISELCKECRNSKMVSDKYGLTKKDLNELFKKQDNKCAICLIDRKLVVQGLAVDHCHTTGKIRGLLCNNCNNGIGRFHDDTNKLKNAIKYLEKNK